MTKEQVSELVVLMRGYVDAKVAFEIDYALDRQSAYAGLTLSQAERELTAFVEGLADA